MLQKLLSAVFLIIVCRTYLLFIIGLGCKLNHNTPSKADACTGSGLPNHANRCVGTVTILGMGNRIGYISLNRDRSKRLHARHPIDEDIPNWDSYGITPFMLCQKGGSGYRHTFSLALDGAKFQNGEALGFILVKNNRPPAHLVKHLIKKHIPWPSQPCVYMRIKGCLILPGIIEQDALQYAHHFDPLIDLNRYAHIYCYIKKGRYYCFVPLNLISLKNNVTQANNATQDNNTTQDSTTNSSPMPLPKEMPNIESEIDQASLDSGIDVRSESPLSLETDELLDALPISNDNR